MISSDTINFKSWWHKYYKKDTVSLESHTFPRNQKISFGISSFSQFTYNIQYLGTIFAYPFINGLIKSKFCLIQPGRSTDVKLPTFCAYGNDKLTYKYI